MRKTMIQFISYHTSLPYLPLPYYPKPKISLFCRCLAETILSPVMQRKKKPKLSTSRSDRFRRSCTLKLGSAVEISSNEDGFRGSWYAATIVQGPLDKHPTKYQIEYKTLFSDKQGKKRLREIVELNQLRPSLPPEAERDFAVGEEVDAYYTDGWWEGVVTEILDNGEFNVFFRSSREQIRFRRADMRLHREWVDGAWTSPLEEDEDVTEEDRDYDDQDEEDEENVLSKLDPETVRTIAKQEFTSNTSVEVSSEEEGFKGSWFAARVIEPIGEDRYLVQYRDLREEDGIEPLKEEVDFLHIRPPPPSNEDDKELKVGDKVDAYYNDGWWIGNVTEILQDGRFGVFFKKSRERIRIGRYGIRLHREWINGNWQLPQRDRNQKNTMRLSCNGYTKKATSRQEFDIGSMIEVSSEEEGFKDSWFIAKIIESRGNNKYLIEYEKLKEEDGKEPLREEVDAINIRPRAPETHIIDRFDKFEKVEALYNDGWWVGEIYKVLSNAKYVVHFKNTREFLKYDHFQLRLHREWVNGKWVTSSKKS